MKYFSNKVLDKKIKEEGGGSGDYTAGEGIDISENEISIDSDTLDDIADGAEARSYFDSNGILSTSRDPFWQIGGTSGLVELKSAYSYVGAKKGIIFSVNQNEDANAHLEVVYKTMAGASNPIPVLHSKLPFYSDSFVSAGGLSSGGGGGGGGGATSLEGLDDVEYTGTPVAGQSLVYVIRDGVGLWTNATPTGGGTVTTVANVPPTSGGDIPKAELSAALGTGTVTQGNSQLVTGGTVYSAINSAISSVLKFEGVSSTPITDGGTQAPTIDGVQVTPYKGMVVLYNSKEFVWSGSAWEELGDEASWALKTITITGTGYLTGGGSLEANRTIDIADAVKTKIEHGESAYNRTDWDQYLGIDANGHIYVKNNKGFYSYSFVSAGGVGAGGGGGGGGATELADLEDINFVTPITGGQVLMYRDLGGGDGEWYNANIEVGGVKTVANVVPTSGGDIPLADLASAFTTGGYKLTDHEYTNGTGLSLSSGTFSLTQAVQTSLGKADTAIQTVYDLVIKNSAGTTELTYKPATNATYSITLTKAMVGLGDVENTKLSTWTGSSNITTVGTISTGTWQGTAIGYNYVAPHYIGGTRTTSAVGQATLLGIDAISNAQSSGTSDLSRIVWDSTNNAWHFLGNLYADGFVSAGGMSDSGGGGGASNLYDLLDMSSTISDKPSGTGQKIIVFNPNGTDKQNRSGAWEYANMPTGSVTSVAGVPPVNGDIPVASLQSAIGLGDYLPLAAGPSYPLINYLLIQNGSDAKIVLDNTDNETNYQYISFRQNGTEYGTLGVRSTGSTDLMWGANTVLHAGNYSTYALPKAGGTMTGVITAQGSLYTDDGTTGGLNMANSNIVKVNGIYTADNAEDASEGINFYRTATTVDSLWASSGVLYFTPNRTLGTDGTSYTVLHTGNYSSYALPRSGGSSYPMTGTLFIAVNNGLQSSGGSYSVLYQDGNFNTLIGQPDSGTYIRSSSSANLVHRKGSTDYIIYDASNLTKSVLTGLLDASGGYYLPLAGGTMTGTLTTPKIRINTKHSSSSTAGGIYFYTSSTDYLLIGYGSSNLWIGANETAGTHHTGSTYISAGAGSGLYVSKLVSSTRGNYLLLDADNYSSYAPILNSASTHATSSSVIYAPTSAGTSGYWLKSSGSGAPTWESASNMTAGASYLLKRTGGSFTSAVSGGVSFNNQITPATGLFPYDNYTNAVLNIDRYNDGSTNYITQLGFSTRGMYIRSFNGAAPDSTTGWNTIYHSGNSNKNNVEWACSVLRVGYQNVSINTGRAAVTIVSTGDYPNDLVFGSNSVAHWSLTSRDSSGDNRLALYSFVTSAYIATVTTSGNIGIGIGNAAASYKLDVKGVTRITRETDGYGVLIGTGGNVIDGISPSGYGNMHLNYNSTGNVSICYGGGNLGVGTSPSYKLHVAGTTGLASGHLYLTGANASSSTANTTQIVFGTSSSNHVVISSNTDAVIINPTTSTTTGQIILGVNSETSSFGNSVTFKGAANRFVSDTWTNVGIKRAAAGGAWICFYPSNQETYFWNVGASTVSSNSTNFSFEYQGNGIKAYLTPSGTFSTVGDQAISSDINLKENLAPVTYSVADIAKTRAVTFDWKDGRGHSAGSIAQDWKPLIPELVHGEEGNMTLAYGQIALVNSILLAKHETEQDKEIKRLKAKVKELETRLNMN